MAVKEKHLNKFIKGLNRDVSEKFQPEGTYRYALNATLDPEKRGALQSEKGIFEGIKLVGGQVIIGTQQLDDHRWIIFSTEDSTGIGIISSYDPIDNILTTLASSNNWGWLTANPIQALLKIQNGCDRFIYFTDNLNPYRVINIDDIGQYGAPFDPTRTNYSRPIASTPDFSLDVKNGGGNDVLVGTYNFAVAYVDRYGNSTNAVHTSQPVPIYLSPVDGDYTMILGNRNLAEGGTGPDGGVPPCQKSVDITLTNLDTNFHSFKIYSIHTVGGFGEITNVLEHKPVKIEGTTGTYTFKGKEDAILSTLQQIDVGNTILNRVKGHAQVDGVLYVANLTDDELDWGTIQRAANTITSSWETIGFNSSPAVVPQDCKTDTGYTTYRSYMRDEIYAFGIQGRLVKNGRLTPVFHIPGRAEILAGDPLIAQGNIHSAVAGTHMRNQVPGATDWDRQLLTVIAGPGGNNTSEVLLANVKHLGFTSITSDPYGDGAGKIQRWRVYNTAISNHLDLVQSATTGEMAFWESTVDYPSQLDCTNVALYPSGKIRHHKFPDTNMQRHCANFAGNDNDISKWIIGIRFDIAAFLAALPAAITSAVEGWEIVRAERTDVNSTVFDKGITYHQANDLESEESVPTTYYTNIVNFVSPRTMFNKDFLGSGYLKIERVMHAEDTEVAIVLAGQAAVAHRDPVHYTTIADEQSHRKIDDAIYLSPPFPYHGPGSGGVGKPSIEDTLGGNVVDSGRYSIHQFSLLLADTMSRYGLPYGTADSGVDQPNSRTTQYCSLKRINDSIYSNFDTLKYYRISNNANYNSNDLLFGGDSFISRYTYREKFTFPIASSWATPETGVLVEQVIESVINTELRSKQTADVMSIYIHNTYIPNYLGLEDIKDPAFFSNSDTRYIDFLDYNKDYSQTNRAGVNIHIPSNFDFCSDCLNSAPYRIQFSDKAFQEQISDNYRVMKFNNYRDMIGGEGEVTGIFIQNDQLYAHTPKTTWYLPTRPQEIATNEGTAQIGTGDLLSVPPKRLSTPGYPYAGCREPFSVKTTEYGTVFVDTEGAAVYMLGESLKDLSLFGMKDWFSKNIPSKMNDYFIDTYQIDYPVTGTTSSIGIGFNTGFDPELKRIIITKKDFSINGTSAITWTGVFWEKDSNPGVPIDFTNSAFTDESWTVSYSLLDQAWVSFHTYTPNLFWNDARKYYSATSARQVWHHNHYNYLQGYSTYNPFQIDFIINPVTDVTKTLSSIAVQMDVETYTLATDSWTNNDSIFFNNLVVYDSYQSTGSLRTLIKDIYETVTAPVLLNNTAYVFKKDRRWMFKDFRDYVTDYTLPLWLNDNDSSGINFHRIANFNAIDPLTKSPFEIQRLRDNWFGCTLYWSYPTGYRISLDSVASTYSQSFR